MTGSGTSQITVTPSSDFDNDTEYYVLIAATAFDDVSGNSYAGISSTTALSFTTDLEDPTNDKDVIGLIEVQTEAPKKIVQHVSTPIYNRLNWIRGYESVENLNTQGSIPCKIPSNPKKISLVEFHILNIPCSQYP